MTTINNNCSSQHGTYYFIKKMIPPDIPDNTIISFNEIMNNIKSIKSSKKKKIILGVIKFTDNKNIPGNRISTI